MNNIKDKSTYRHPRTMAEAFGPYTDRQLTPMKPEKPSMLPWLVWGLLLIAIGISIYVYEIF